jgi:acetylornithine aminotransferase
MASFHTNKSRVISFHNAFHGRTSAAVATTDNKKIVAYQCAAVNFAIERR